MASSGSESHDRNDAVYSSTTEETTSINNQLSVVPGKHFRVSTTIPSDVIPEILCKLPMKVGHKFRCVCKSWNSLISDPKFIKKQLRMFTTLNLHFLNYAHDSRKYILTSYPLESVFTNITSNFTQSEYSSNHFTRNYPSFSIYSIIGSCNGIVCIADDNKGLVILWNPSTREFKELPLFKKPVIGQTLKTFGFGYDSSKNNYKVVVVLSYLVIDGVDEDDEDDFLVLDEGDVDENDSFYNRTKVKVHTLGTNIWRTVHQYPFGSRPVSGMKGQFVSGTINWLFSKEWCWKCPRFIVSFDFAKESYQKISPPYLGGVDVCDLSALGVLRDCLCVTTYGHDVWIMKEYGNKESWTKLFNIPYMRDPSKSDVFAKPIYMFEDDQMLLMFLGDGQYDSFLFLYDPTSGTLRATKFKKTPEVCGESLISAYSLC